MVKEFKEFILRGSVVDLAVGIVIGVAFTTLVNSFVKNLLTPVTTIAGKVSFSSLHFTIGHSTFHYGAFLNDLISFLLIAAALFFFVVKPMNVLAARRRTGAEAEPGTRDCPACRSEIPALATRCPHCTSAVEPTGMPETAPA